jgi:hypothetical protein
MVTALSLYATAQQSSVLTTANKMYTTSGTPAYSQSFTRVGTSLGFGEVYSQGSITGWPALGAIGSPSGHGFFFDSTILQGNQLVAGSYNFVTRLSSQQGEGGGTQSGTLVGDVYVRLWKYNSGTYTLIASASLTAQTLAASPTTQTFGSVTGSLTSFSTGDYAYWDIWVNLTQNNNALSTQDIRLNRLSTDTSGLTGDPNEMIATPGYQPTGGVVTLPKIYKFRQGTRFRLYP